MDRIWSMRDRSGWLSDVQVPKLADVASAAILACLAGCLYFIVYQVWFHPLAKYPGPWLAKFTNLYAAYQSWIGDIHLDIHRCHQKYGAHVRYGPNRVMINTAGGLRDMYGHGAQVRKSPAYLALSQAAANTLTIADKAQHAYRRRILSQAFSESSMRRLEPLIQERIKALCTVIRGQVSESVDGWSSPIDMGRTSSNVAFDVMMAVSFGAQYHTIEKPQFRYVMNTIEQSNVRLGALMQAMELTFAGVDKILLADGANAGLRFVKFVGKVLKNRLQQDSGVITNDIFSFLLKCKDPNTGDGLSPMEISTETATFIVAGSDTISIALASLVYYLAWSPRCYKRAAEEVRAAFSSSEEIGFGAKLNSCVFLRACLDEALRITPPGGGPLWREVEQGGTRIDGEYVPAGCEVAAAIYSMHRSERNWTNPDSYMPERWLDNKEKDKAKNSTPPYFPFGIGPRSCVGKPLALVQIMLTFAHLLWEFDFRRADASDLWWEGDDINPPEYMLKDHVTGHKTGPVLQFRPRFS